MVGPWSGVRRPTEEGIGIRLTSNQGDAGVESDRSDWESFYAFCDEAIRAALACRSLQAADREDCRQEIWLEILTTGMSRFRGGNLRRWLSTVARNKAVDKVRCGRRRPLRSLLDPEMAAIGDPDGPCPADESRSMVWAALAELERQVEQRSFLVFFLRWIEGWTIGETAAALGLTPEQARSRHHRTKAKFRQVVEGRAACGEGDGA